MSTTRTGLAGVARINFLDTNPACLRFVGKKRVELGKRPAMHAALSLTFAMGDPLSDIRQVLQHDGTARSGVLNKTFGEDMVVIFSLPKPLARKLFQVPFGRFASFFLKLAAQAEDAAFLLLPLALSQEMAIAGDSRTVEAQVYSNHFCGWRDNWSRKRDNDMQEVTSLAKTQVRRAHVAAEVCCGVFGNGEIHLNASCHAGKATGHALPLDPVRTLVIADWCTERLWAVHRLEWGRVFPTPDCLCNPPWITNRVFFLPWVVGF